MTHPQSLAGTAPEFPLHPGTVAYRDRDQPMVSREVLDVLAKLVTFWLFISATYYALTRNLLRDPTRRFVYYLREFISPIQGIATLVSSLPLLLFGRLQSARNETVTFPSVGMGDPGSMLPPQPLS